MDREIKSFFVDPVGYGIDLTDAEVYVLVPPSGGSIFYGDEPTVSLSSAIGFRLECRESGDALLSIVCVAEGGGTTLLPVGTTSDLTSAGEWVKQVNLLYTKQQ